MSPGTKSEELMVSVVSLDRCPITLLEDLMVDLKFSSFYKKKDNFSAKLQCLANYDFT